MKEMVNYMSYLRTEYDELCKKQDNSIKEVACRRVCLWMFDGLTYGINKFKLNMLKNTLDTFRQLKNK